MKFNPYPVLLATGALMLATVIFTQIGASVALLGTGATDDHALATRDDHSSQDEPSLNTRIASLDRSTARAGESGKL